MRGPFLLQYVCLLFIILAIVAVDSFKHMPSANAGEPQEEKVVYQIEITDIAHVNQDEILSLKSLLAAHDLMLEVHTNSNVDRQRLALLLEELSDQLPFGAVSLVLSKSESPVRLIVKRVLSYG